MHLSAQRSSFSFSACQARVSAADALFELAELLLEPLQPFLGGPVGLLLERFPLDLASE